MVCLILWSGHFKFKFGKYLLLLAAGSALYYRFIYLPAHRTLSESVYVVPSSVEVVDTPAEVRMTVGSVQRGDQVGVLSRTRNWTQVKLSDGRNGWIESKYLVDSETFDTGRRLLKELATLPPQAIGHTTAPANLRLEPSRDSPQLTQLPENQKVEVFGRRLIDRVPITDQSFAPQVRDVWYLIRTESVAGWALGRFVSLDVPVALSTYAQGSNLVGWVVLDTVSDGGQRVAQYLVADREGIQDVDFNHIRILTWWLKRHQYVTAYVEGGLPGYFPIRVVHVGGVTYFRLRLRDGTGHKYQKVYGLFDTITRALGTVDGWESDAMPERPPLPRKGRRGK
jgi:hypothetical protein